MKNAIPLRDEANGTRIVRAPSYLPTMEQAPLSGYRSPCSMVTTRTGQLDQVAPALELGLARFGQLEVAGLDLARGFVVRHDHPGRVDL